MPIYVHQCPACGVTQEGLQKATDSPPECAPCGSTGATVVMIKQNTIASFVLSGTGWFKAGYSGK